nr:ISAs1 family transposase [Zhenpiania hominis]
MICIYAVLAGHSEGSDIAFYAELNFEYFKEKTQMKRVPSHDTFSRLLRMVSFEKLSFSLGAWLKEMFPEICERYKDMKILRVDGKAVRAASEKGKGEKPRYLLNAMYEGESIGLKVKEVGEKENEISCLPEYLKLFELNKTIVTIDAMGCNQTVIQAIVDRGGSYVIPVKENQKRLLRTIEEELERLKQKGKYEKLDGVEQINKSHGRIERIKGRLIQDTSFLYEKLGLESIYGSIARIGVIEKKTVQTGTGEISHSRQIVITNLEELDIENLVKIRQGHWNIEMQHWLLDVQLKEDQKTARKEGAMTSGAVLRRFCLMMKKYDEQYSDKPMKRFIMANEHDIHRIEKLLFEKKYEN